MKPFLALEASAGSGKTFALSVRFIATILSGANPSEIIALTFTKKAANEMKERIVSTFVNLHSHHAAELSHLALILGKSEEEILKIRDKQMARFLESNLKISTFDSFFTSILRQFSLNLGLNPDFLVSSNLKDLQRLQFISKVAKEPNLLKRLAVLIVNSGKSKASFFETLEAFYDNFGSLKIDENAKFPSPIMLQTALLALFDYAQSSGGSSVALNSFKPAGAVELLERSFVKKDSLNYKTYAKIYTPRLDELFFDFKAKLKAYFDELEAYRISELGRFLEIYRSARIELNKRLNTLTFSDINALVYELLCDNFDNELLYFRLDGRINHLLIDEFQDTNVKQYEIMKPLIDEIVAGYGQNGLGSFFYVGDTKQSIYRFRGGKKELFDKLKGDFKQIENENLDTNYRSLKAIVKFSNAVFRDKISNYIDQKASKKDDERLVPVADGEENFYFASEADDYGYVSVVGSEDVVNEAINQVKNLISQGVNEDDITILCWKNDDVDVIAAGLESEGIKSVSEGATTLIKSPFVGALIEYAKFCIFGDEIYKLNVEAILNIKVSRLEIDPQKPAFQSLKYLADKLCLDGSNSDLLRLYEISCEYVNLANFIFNASNIDQKATSKSQNGVCVMTVHKSKGLQFEHVVVCDKIGGDRVDSSNFICEYDINGGWQIKHRVNKESIDDEFAELKNRTKQLEYAEDINKLYVAFTRAISSLIIIKKLNAAGKNPSFFSSYISNNEVVEYLNLQEFSFGKILPSKISDNYQNHSKEEINLIKIARQEVDVKEQDGGKNLDAIYFGLALHYMLEMCNKFDENELEIAKISMQNRFGKVINQDKISDIYNCALNLIKNEKFQEFVSGKVIFKEQPLRFKNSLKQIDLLCFSQSEICIIDYKTSKKNIEENIAQIGFYKEAMRQIYPNFSVRAALFYAFKDRSEVIEI